MKISYFPSFENIFFHGLYLLYRFISVPLFTGIFYSAVSISRDIELRKSVPKYAISEFKFVCNIGYAKTENQMKKMANKIVNEQRGPNLNKKGFTIFNGTRGYDILYEIGNA